MQNSHPSPTVHWRQITTFHVELGSAQQARMKVHIFLPGVEKIDIRLVHCTFQHDRVDLQVTDLNGQAWRFYRNDLQHDIVPEKSSFHLRRNYVVLSLQKERRGSQYDTWTDLLSVASCKWRQCCDPKMNPPDFILKYLGHLCDHGDDNLKLLIQQSVDTARDALRTLPMTPTATNLAKRRRLSDTQADETAKKK